MRLELLTFPSFVAVHAFLPNGSYALEQTVFNTKVLDFSSK